MINFNFGNKSYTNTQYATRSYTQKDYVSVATTTHIYNPKVTHLGITNNSFDIINNPDTLQTGTSLIVHNSELPKDSTYVELYLKINSNTLSNNNLSYTTQLDTEQIFLIINSTNDPSAFALVSYQIENQIFTNPTILKEGSFISTESKTLDSLSNAADLYYMNGDWTKEWLAPIRSINCIHRDLGSFPLGSTFSIIRSNNSLNNYIGPENDAVIDVKFTLNKYTAQISGGSNYVIGDTFTIDDGNASEAGKITVTGVSHNGSITSIDTINLGFGFIDQPEVVYNGSTGSNCNIIVNDTYSIVLSVVDGGNGYSSKDYLGVQYPDSDTLIPLRPQDVFRDNTTLEPLEATFEIIPYVFSKEPLLNNQFSIDRINVVNPGFNHLHKPLLKLVNLQTETLIQNTYITSNSNHFINTREIL